MFKVNNQHQQLRSKSPYYQPKLLQHLIDSSDNDSDYINEDNNYQKFQKRKQKEDFLDQDEDQEISQEYGNGNSNNSRTNSFTNDHSRSQKSFHTTLTQQTTKSCITQKSVEANNKILKVSEEFQAKLYIKGTDKLIAQKQKQSIETQNPFRNIHKNRQNPIAKLQQTSTNYPQKKQLKQRSSHSPILNIKYDSLKLSEYNTDGIKRQEELYQKNLKDFKQRFNTSKPFQNQNSKQQSRTISEQNNSNNDDQYIDSLQAMKRSNINKKTLLNKSKQHINNPPSSRIKFIQQNRQSIQKQKQSQKQSNTLNFNTNKTNKTMEQNLVQLQNLRNQLKRSKDIIKTLGLKNNDLQKTLEMNAIKLEQLQQLKSSYEINSRVNCGSKNNNYKQIYENITLFIKEKAKQFVMEIKEIKMNPLLEEKLQNFLAQILQINYVTVNKQLGIQNHINYRLFDENSQHQRIKSQSQKQTPSRLSKSIFNTKSPFRQKQQLHNNNYSTIVENNFRGRYQTQSHITIINNQNNNNRNNRNNYFLNNKIDQDKQSNQNGMIVKLDLSSNKQNATPNKMTIKADNQLRALQKSLNKLKTMQKQLSTPMPKSRFTATVQQGYVTNNINRNRQNQVYNEYSIINKNHFSYIKNQQQQQADKSIERNINSIVNNNSMNISNNLDRSKSRRKKIFADR